MSLNIRNLLILAPLSFELECIYEQARNFGGFESIGDLVLSHGNKKIHFFTTGQGKVNAAIAMTKYFYELNPDLIIIFGSCGGLTEQFNVGDVIQVSEVEEFDFISSFKGAKNPKFKAFSNNRLVSSGFPLCKIASGDKDVISIEDRKKLHLLTNADVVAWESAGFVKAARRLNQSYLEFRVVVDSLNKSEFDKNGAKEHLKLGAQKVLDFIKTV